MKKPTLLGLVGLRESQKKLKKIKKRVVMDSEEDLKEIFRSQQ